MIFKHELVEAINSMSHDLTLLSIKVSDLEKKVEKLEKAVCKCKACPKACPKKVEKKAKKTAKRGPGRPRKK